MNVGSVIFFNDIIENNLKMKNILEQERSCLYILQKTFVSFTVMSKFLYPWKSQKTFSFFMFSGSIEVEQSRDLGRYCRVIFYKGHIQEPQI